MTDVQSPVETPVVVDTAPVAETTHTPITNTETSAVETAPTADPVVESAPVTNTLLSEEPPVTENLAPESETVEPKNEGDSQSDEPAPQLPTYEAFTLPEGITADNELLTEFTKDLAELELNTKADHAEMQKFGQKLIDRYMSETTQTIDRLNKHYADAWEKQKNDWKDSFEKDPEIGGNRRDTTLEAARSFIKTHGGTPEQQKEIRQFMQETGVGNHPVLIRLLSQAGVNMQEGRPLPATTPVPQVTSKVAKRYGSM